LWQARLGRQWKDYVEYHSKYANDYHRERNEGPYARPCILSMDGASNCSYFEREMFDFWMKATPGTAIAHLLSIGGLMNSHHQYYEYWYEDRENRTSIASEVDCHEWWNGTRLLGVRSGDNIVIHPGLPGYEKLVQKHLDQLWGANHKGVKGTTNGFWHLVQMDKRYFTDYPKQGDRMDNHEPEFLTIKVEKLLGGPKQFRTTIGGYHGFFKYGINEVKSIAPSEANAYTIGDIKIEYKDGNPTHHVGPVTFYKVEVDTTRRLIRMNDIYRDFELIMLLVD
ncbi:MAG: hypothetical protein AAB575_04700, partial [Patescibacteria group bacterium]